jgi:Uma2 family endonuclease
MQWQEVLADPSLKNLPYKIELNEHGLIEMSPASLNHSRLQGRIAALLLNQLGGEVFTELAIQTRKGVRVPNVAWGSQHYLQQHQAELWASAAPELCVEIVSQSNSAVLLQERVQLFLDAGALEIWLVDENGQVSYFDRQGQQSQSRYSVDLTSIQH